MGRSQVIVVHSPTGGVGKTLLALHLACLYAEKGLFTVLVDLAQYGAVAPWLQIPRGICTGLTGLITALEEGGVADERIRGAIVPGPGAKGLHLVLSSGPAKMDQVKNGQVEMLLQHLRSFAEVVIVDTGSDLHERTLGALLGATKIVLVLQPSVVAGWQTLELLDVLRSAYVSRDKLGVVINRVQKGARFGLEEYRQALELPTLGSIPECPVLRWAPDQGGPPALRGQAPGIQAIRQVAHQLIPIFTPKELKRSWLLSR